MPSKAYPIGEWLPDQPGGVSIARNVHAIANGYMPAKGLQAATSTMGGAFRGGGAFIDSTGAVTLLVTTPTALLKYTGAATTGWSNVGGSFGTTQIARFAQFGDNVTIAGAATIYNFNLLSATATTPTAAPDLIDVAQARDFVIGITTDNKLQWCQFNDVGNWTTGTNQADTQPSLWGQLRRVVGGEYVIAITDRSVVRGTYVGVVSGLDIVWQFDEISQEVGCMADGSVANVGRLIFFLSERGFMMCDGQTVEPIADEKFNRWFFDKYSRQDIANIWAAIDPRTSTVKWAMPGTPGTIIEYNWTLKKATTLEIDVTGMLSGFTSAVGLDSLDAIYGNLDSIPISLDDPFLSGGNPLLLIADGSNVLNSLTGDNLEATIQLDSIEPTPGRRSRIREVRLVTDATQASATIDARMRVGDAESIRSASSMRSNGKMPIRANGRYNDVAVTIPAATDWTYIQGCELEFEPGDGR